MIYLCGFPKDIRRERYACLLYTSGSQLMMHLLGGKVEKAPVREYGKIEVTVNQNSKLFENVSEKTICWMSHNDYISQIAPGFEISAHTADCPVAAVENKGKNLYATQFLSLIHI